MEAPYQKSWFKKGQADQSQKRSSRFSRHDQASKLNKLLEDQSVDLDANHKGFVWIVGAGPHDPDLLTVKAVKAIMSAEVLLYDRLVNKDILELASPQADWIYVGKRCGQPSIGQEEICDLMVSLAQQGKRVVRLKGGDPFVFGRGGEEALALVKHAIPYEVIPGITAAIGCSANSLIPLTHRGVARSVTFVTAQVVTGAFESWCQLMQSGQTLVFYMGLEKSSQIQTGLISSGLRENFPVAVITHGCSPQQQVYVTQLNQLNELSITLKGISPALIVMGEVVKLREQLIETVQSVTEFEGI
ncbi:TPA: uroporphyrinogen-III C-methyltransferase [Vibrio parahaemolyticus]|nr:uroporphyrinogen-III C-methyltransferase [Vibrio parahaemolyticus]HCG7080117.1 uroporphyrinogen-III C-methyltransferase [Vibrio parahaemolyticus]HCH0721827.1 uroporphyrinogen-III C-methyltransferase [Vibrio parahaemolyticus]HCH0789691.1 uroporphyrinogen-III C-methyltransferase [Vibrio parahaemolyticus]HCH1050359.1 uroporphyrinogen-III C-methyltransferase [Vibrio parahaemolyticus]